MTGESESQPYKKQLGNPPPRSNDSVVIRIFRALRRQLDSTKRRTDKQETPHQINERILAHWTRRLGWFTFLMVVVGAVTTKILYDTDHAFRNANRTFVYFDKIIPQSFSIKNEFVYGLGLSISNNGNTPTKNLRIRTDCPVGPIPQGEDPFSLLKGDGLERFVLGPKQSVTLGICQLNESEVYAVQNRTVDRFIVGEAIYQDIFGNEPHKTRFVVQIFFSEFSGGLNGFNWSSQSVGNFNCADDDCPH